MSPTPFFTKKIPTSGNFLIVLLFFLMMEYPLLLIRFLSVAFFKTLPETTKENLLSLMLESLLYLKEKCPEESCFPLLTALGKRAVVTLLF